jgi:GntR family transcriptional regulator/MocR family aminotransferase
MLNLAIDRASEVALYRQLANQIRDLILRGVLSPGERLPPVRQVAQTLDLTRLTAHSAYTELQAQGLVESFVGRGTFVAQHPRSSTPLTESSALPRAERWASQGLLVELAQDSGDEGIISFTLSYPAPETVPVHDFERALRHVLREPGGLSYGPLAGEPVLREQVSRLLLERAIAISPDHLLITSGAQQALDIALRALAQAGDTILIEEPAYPGVIEIAAQLGHRIVGIPLDEDGISLVALEEACVRFHPRLLCVTPTYHNPTGVSLAPDRREGAVRIAERHGLVIVEDDTYGFLGLEGETAPALKSLDTTGCVVHVTSFSKSLLPGLRLGTLVADPRYLPRLAAAKQSIDVVSSPLLQRALAAYLRQGAFSTHLKRVRPLYHARKQALLESLQRWAPQGCAWTRPAGGLSVWLTLPDGVDERDVAHEARERGVGVAAGNLFFAQPTRRGHFRLCFGLLPPERIERGIEILCEVITQHQQQRDSRLAHASRSASPLV